MSVSVGWRVGCGPQTDLLRAYGRSDKARGRGDGGGLVRTSRCSTDAAHRFAFSTTALSRRRLLRTQLLLVAAVVLLRLPIPMPVLLLSVLVAGVAVFLVHYVRHVATPPTLVMDRSCARNRFLAAQVPLLHARYGLRPYTVPSLHRRDAGACAGRRGARCAEAGARTVTDTGRRHGHSAAAAI